MVASALDAIVVHDERGRIIEFNPATERTFGYRRGEAVGRDLSRADPPRLRGQNAATQKCVALDLDAADRSECLLDAPKVRPMLDQFFSNAIKFTPGGRAGQRGHLP
ncbi:MAG: PAS domain S-box protein [Pseudomonadota bacterium]